MLRYVDRRLLLLVPILLGVSILIFFWVHALPGNPASALLGERATPELVQQYKERYGLKRRFPATIELAFAAMIFAVGIGLPLGFFAAKHYGGVFDHLSLVGSLIGISIPIFFLAIILKYFFAVRWHVLPSVGREDVLANNEHPTGF